MDEKLEHRRVRVVLCAASAYDKKYYFNRTFDRLPESVKDELHILCVLFTEEVGGIFTIVFTPAGDVEMETQADEGDLLYDEIGCGLMIRELRRKKKELFESLSMFYRIMILHEDPGSVFDEESAQSDLPEYAADGAPDGASGTVSAAGGRGAVIWKSADDDE